MYKATHQYRAEQDHILSFSSGETLCILEKNNDSWWLASNSRGKVGYVPRTYIIKEQEDSNDVVLQSVNNAIEEIISSAPAGMLKPQQQALLKKLVSHKESLVANMQKSQHSTKRRAPPPPPTPSTNATAPVEIPKPVKNKETSTPPVVPERVHSLASSETLTDKSKSPDVPIKHDVPDDIGLQLMHVLQTTLNISESKSRGAISALLLTMKAHIPTLEAVFKDISMTLPQENNDEESDKLALALENLREIKDDAQQRNWAIGNDEDNIMAILTEILTELTAIERESSIKALAHDQYVPIHTLVDYHQMETRVSLRLVILQIFGVICSLSKSLVSALLATVLPLELAMDMTNHTQETQKTCYSALVMSMLFSTAEPIPYGHYSRLNNTFIEFLIKYIEDEIDYLEPDGQTVEMFVNILLSFSLHFPIPSENIVMNVISERTTCTALSEKIMMLVNRGDDPVVMEEHWETDDKGRPPPSVLKFLQDIFSQRSTSTFFYTNDMNVLIDITARNLTDLPSGSKLRTEYLDLLLNILMNTDYSESRHRAVDIGQNLNRILEEEQPDTEKERLTLEFDKRIIDKIMSNFSHLFS